MGFGKWWRNPGGFIKHGLSEVIPGLKASKAVESTATVIQQSTQSVVQNLEVTLNSAQQSMQSVIETNNEIKQALVQTIQKAHVTLDKAQETLNNADTTLRVIQESVQDMRNIAVLTFYISLVIGVCYLIYNLLKQHCSKNQTEQSPSAPSPSTLARTNQAYDNVRSDNVSFQKSNSIRNSNTQSTKFRPINISSPPPPRENYSLHNNYRNFN